MRRDLYVYSCWSIYYVQKLNDELKHLEPTINENRIPLVLPLLVVASYQ